MKEKTKSKYLLNKYENLSAPVKASIWFTICNVVQKGIALISTPIFTRIMTTQQYGVYTIYQSWYQVLTIFATLNLSAGVFNNGLTKYPDKKNRLVSSLQGLSTTVTFLLFLIYIAYPKFWNDIFGIDQLYSRHSNTKMLGIQAGSCYSYWFFPERVLRKTIKHIFEGEMFNIPEEYDRFLKVAYGDYMKLPPENERVTHEIEYLDFGNVEIK